jgi:hypothetical protein
VVAATESTMIPAPLDRPFYFIVVLWGERFRKYFLDYCVASLLSPGNLPALNTSRPSKFLIATRPQDWAVMAETRIFQSLKRYVEPVFIEIPACPPGRSGCQHMGVGHSIACDMAHRDKAFAAVLTPDCMLSDGSVARLQELARNGTELVLTAALRFGEEPFLAHLREQGLLADEDRTKTGTPLVLPGRQMVYAAVNGFHSETSAYEWDAPGVLVISPAAWWRVPGEDGIVLHSLSWAPLLLDYASVGDHDVSTFDQWTLDGDYLFNNAGKMKKIHVVQDSDEVFLASWAPLADRPVTRYRVPFENLIAGNFFRRSFYSNFFDPLKRKLFFQPVRWHSKALNEKWVIVEHRATDELARWVEPPEKANAASVREAAGPLRRIANAGKNLLLSALTFFVIVWIYRSRIPVYANSIIRGDRDAIRRITWFVRHFMLGFVFGRAPIGLPNISSAKADVGQ